jgi:trehalose-phosphatase
MMDYDGTLAPFNPVRDKAILYPGVRGLIGRIMDSGRTKAVIVTGRTIVDLMSVIDLDDLPEIWGSHGWERRRRDGSYEIWPADEKHLRGLGEAKTILVKSDLMEYCEEKPRSVAIHWRGLDQAQILLLERFADGTLARITKRFELERRDFDGGAEIRIPGRSKGDVVRTMIEESGDGSFLVYLGDDLTDEDAFSAIKGRGAGILVGQKKRPSKAEFFIKPPDDLLDFLENWLISVEGGSRSAD